VANFAASFAKETARKSGNATANLADAFTKETARKSGQSERKVRRDAHRGAALGPDLDRIARKQPILLNQSEQPKNGHW
jgi:hypothetical protein